MTVMNGGRVLVSSVEAAASAAIRGVELFTTSE
jgi:hypothetical protein